MALVDFQFRNYGHYYNNNTLVTHALDASTDAYEFIVPVHKTGTISKIGFLYTAKTGTAPTYRLGVESVGTHVASGTYLGSTNAAYVDVADPATGFAWQTLGETVSVTVGDMVAGTIRHQTGTVDGSNFSTVGVGATGFGQGYSTPYANTIDAGTPTVVPSSRIVVGGLQYDDGTVVRNCLCLASVPTAATWNSGSNPRFRGIKFTPAVGCRISGASFYMRAADTSDWSVELYEGSSTSPLASTAVDWSAYQLATVNLYVMHVPLAPTTLTASTVYRLVLNPTTANSQAEYYRPTFADADSVEAIHGPIAGTTALTVAGGWTDSDTAIYPIFPEFDQVDSGSSGGGSFVISG